MTFESNRRSKFSEADQRRIFDETNPWGPHYRPARPLGNRHDAEIIARQSGRPVEDFLAPAELATRAAMKEDEPKDNVGEII